MIRSLLVTGEIRNLVNIDFRVSAEKISPLLQELNPVRTLNSDDTSWPKSGAQVHMSAGTEPVLLTGTFGQGKVAVFTGTVLGQAAPNAQPFWTWNGWPGTLSGTLSWLAKNPVKKP